MRQLAVIFLFLFVGIISLAQSKCYFPVPLGFINDYEGDFSKEEVKALDLAVKDMLTKAMERELLKGVEIAIVTVTDSMFGDEKDMSSYAMKLGSAWGVGSKGENNGIIIAISRRLRKVTIATGTGLDGILTSQDCQKIIDEKMAPEFRKGQYYNAAMNAIRGISEFVGIK